MRKTKLFLSLLMVMLFSVGNVWAETITSVANIESGKRYYIRATKSDNTDWYLSVAGHGEAGTGLQGTAVSDAENADVFTFTKSGNNWTIQFANGNYLSLANSKANGKVNVQISSAAWTITDVSAKNLINLKINNYCLQRNTGSSTNFGSYGSGQLDVWLESAGSAEPAVYVNPTEIDFGEVGKDADVYETFTLTAENLTSGLTIEASNGFSIFIDELTAEEAMAEGGVEIEVSPVTYEKGEKTGTITISGDDLDEAIIVPISVNVVAVYYTVGVAVNDGAMGTATINGEASISTETDENFTLVATPNEGYRFDHWEYDDNSVYLEKDDAATTTASLSDGGNATITAVFVSNDGPELTVNVDGLDFGEVDVKSEPETKSFTITGSNLIGDVTLTIEEHYSAGFILSATSFTKEEVMTEGGVTVYVTSVTDKAGNFLPDLTISTEGIASNKTVELYLSVNKIDAEMSWSASTATADIDLENTYPTLTKPEDATVTYSSSNTGVAAIDSEGAITLVAPGSTTITASIKDDDIYENANESYELTVVKYSTARWYVNGAELTEVAQTAVAGTTLEFPADPVASGDCADLFFQGWVEAPLASAQDEAPIYTSKTEMPAADVNFYAVFATKGVGTTTKTYGFEDTEADESYWTIDGPNKDNGKQATGSYAGKINTNNTYVTFNEKVNVTNFSFKFTRTSTNSNYNVYIETSTDNSTWTPVETYAMGSFSNGTFDLKSKDFDGNTAYYVRFHCHNTTAVRYVDDLSITYSSTSYTDFLTTCPQCNTVTLAKAEAEHGAFTLKVNGVEATSVKTCEGATVDVEFEPATGYTLDAFTVSGVEGATYADGKITIPEGETGTLVATATFKLAEYTVTMEQTGGAEATLSEDQTGKHMDDEITVTAENKTGYIFLGWEATPAVTFADAEDLSTTFTMPASNVTVTANYIRVYTLAELVDPESDAGTTVNVKLENEKIKSIYTYNDYRCGLTFDYQKGGNDIRIFVNKTNVDAAWGPGGKVSGILLNANWAEYSGDETWQIKPASGFAWSDLTYEAPSVVPTALDNTAVEAKAVKSLQNGMLIIEKGGKKFNAQGQLIK